MSWRWSDAGLLAKFLNAEVLLPTTVFTAALMLAYVLLGSFIKISFDVDVFMYASIETAFYVEISLAFICSMLRLLYRLRTGQYKRDPRLGMF